MARPGRKKTELRPDIAEHGRRLGALIRQRRDARQLSRLAVANESSVSPQQLAKVERGDVADPGFLLIGRIAERLDLELGSLYRVATGREGHES